MSNSPTTDLYVGVIGLGRIASQTHLKNLSTMTGVKVRAVCDVDVARAEEMGKTYSAKPYADFQEMLDQEQLDAVIICTPPTVRLEPIRLAAQKKIAVFAEKPPAARFEDALEIARVVQEHQIINGVGFMYRYSYAIDELKDLIADQRLSMIRSIFVCDPALDPAQPKWFFNKSLSGGPVLDQAIHVLDLTRYIAGDVSTVQAFGANVIFPKTEEFTIEDSVTINLKYRSGAIQNHLHSWSCRNFKLEIELISDDMHVYVTPYDFHGKIGDQQVSGRPESNDFYRRELEEFFQAVREQDQSRIRSPYVDAVNTLATVMAANLSIDDNRIIDLGQAPWNRAEQVSA